MQKKKKHFCNAFLLETNPRSTTTIQNVKPNRSSMQITSLSPRKYNVIVSARQVVFNVFWSCRELFTWNFRSKVKVNALSDIFHHSELSNTDSDLFAVVRTQSCNTAMLVRTSVAELKTP
ncbi:hypothetical protein ElyMa_005374200 [Elysia marginata]|uniref:Uncharacterized protein n=1 Tax=Elysia marginata TaxID=1093978 RepID=A0AAV4ED83_9GAST|nr:hypothetical protein ElyMa_005374200 [Elysia marginata]